MNELRYNIAFEKESAFYMRSAGCLSCQLGELVSMTKGQLPVSEFCLSKSCFDFSTPQLIHIVCGFYAAHLQESRELFQYDQSERGTNLTLAHSPLSDPLASGSTC